MTSPLVNEASEKSQEIEQKIREFFDKVNEVIGWVPGIFSGLIEPIVQGMEQVRQKMQEFWDRVNQLFEQPGNSERLREVGVQWADSIGNVLGEIADTVSRTSFGRISSGRAALPRPTGPPCPPRARR
jgi:methyl-accepting chemotaxis protein